MRRLRLALLVVLAAVAAAARAAGPLADIDIPQTPDARRKGAETVVTVCLGCHSLKYLSYGDLAPLGFTAAELDALRSGKGLKDALQTDMAADMLRESFGSVPPDLSLMAKAREGGPRYIYSLLTGFYQKPDGSVDNRLFPGIKMPDVLNYSDTGAPAKRAALQEQARDTAAFLLWAADPRAPERFRLGYFVMAYLGILTGFLYWSKRRVWSRLDQAAATQVGVTAGAGADEGRRP